MVKAFMRLILLFSLCLLLPSVSYAQASEPPSREVIGFTRSVSKQCLAPKGWMHEHCLKVMAESNKYFAANYMAQLKQAGHMNPAETIKNNCAASTAIDTPDTPINAIGEAMVTCANSVADVTRETTMYPDLNHFQLILASSFCYRGGTSQCAQLETALGPYSK